MPFEKLANKDGIYHLKLTLPSVAEQEIQKKLTQLSKQQKNIQAACDLIKATAADDPGFYTEDIHEYDEFKQNEQLKKEIAELESQLGKIKANATELAQQPSWEIADQMALTSNAQLRALQNHLEKMLQQDLKDNDPVLKSCPVTALKSSFYELLKNSYDANASVVDIIIDFTNPRAVKAEYVDNGDGFPKEIAKKPSKYPNVEEHAHSPSTKAGKSEYIGGNGLGLFRAAWVVQQNGSGDMYRENVPHPGKGAIIRFEATDRSPAIYEAGAIAQICHEMQSGTGTAKLTHAHLKARFGIPQHTDAAQDTAQEQPLQFQDISASFRRRKSRSQTGSNKD